MDQYKVPCGTVAGYDKKCEVGNICPACHEIVKLREQVRELEGLKLFAQLQQVGKFAEAMGEIRTLLTDKEADEMARTVARARLSAIVRDITATEIPTQDPKYVIIGGKLCNSITKEPIPDDEPIMIFRAKDNEAAELIDHYCQKFPEDSPHRTAVFNQFMRFFTFAQKFPDRMKRADS